MITSVSFENKLSDLKKKYEHGSFEYNDPSTNFRTIVTSHFRGISRKKKRYGIYIVRQKNTPEVLYIGKSGTIDSQGQFKGQDIPGRLKNVKGGNISADKWFRDLLQEKGPLVIEYIFLSTSKSPAFVEAFLLQAYLNERHNLPYKNKSL